MNPEIQQVRNTAGNKVLMSGSAPFYNTATPGYVHYFFDQTTLAFTQGTYYGTTNPSNWGGAIYDTYINTGIGMNIFTAAQNNGVPNNYHLLKTSDLGDNGCDNPTSIAPVSCVFDYYTIQFTQRDNPAVLSVIKLFAVAPMANTFTESCYVTCPGCELAPIDDPMISTVKSAGLNENRGVEAFPNPTTGLMQLKAEGKFSEVSVYTLLGKQVSAEILVSDTGASIDLTNEPKGVYILRFLMDGEQKALRIFKD
jgi:hypothetical protein